jgi:hypothetical protein
VLSLVYPSRTRVALSILKTDNVVLSFEPFFAAPTALDPDNTYLATITP